MEFFTEDVIIAVIGGGAAIALWVSISKGK
jgi:hypoxanthine phosphoribosyltransferase